MSPETYGSVTGATLSQAPHQLSRGGNRYPPALIHSSVEDVLGADDLNGTHNHFQNLLRVHLEPPPHHLRHLKPIPLLQHRGERNLLSESHSIPIFFPTPLKEEDTHA
jgi:hypothetical protein